MLVKAAGPRTDGRGCRWCDGIGSSSGGDEGRIVDIG